MKDYDPERQRSPSHKKAHGSMCISLFRRWTMRKIFVAVCTTFVFAYVFRSYNYDDHVRLYYLLKPALTVGTSQDSNLNAPPRYLDLIREQAASPSHNLSLPLPEGANGRYVIFNSQNNGVGWNNVLNEM